MKNFFEITSKENSLIKLTSLLQSSSKARKEHNLFVLEGLRICLDAAENGILFDKLIVSKTAYSKYISDIERLSEIAENCYIIPDSLFKKISDTTNPQGIICIANIPVSNISQIDLKGRYIALENVADPSNLGAVARTAEAMGVTGIILSDGGCDPYSPKALRASMGTILRLPIIIFEDFSNQINKTTLKTYSCVVDIDAIPISNVRFCDGIIVIIGNEANGITDETKKNSDYKITIPMKGRVESLNAAVAASISIWEMMK